MFPRKFTIDRLERKHSRQFPEIFSYHVAQTRRTSKTIHVIDQRRNDSKQNDPLLSGSWSERRVRSADREIAARKGIFVARHGRTRGCFISICKPNEQHRILSLMRHIRSAHKERKTLSGAVERATAH